MSFACGSFFLLCCTRVNTAIAAVVTHARDVHIVHNRGVIDVVDVCNIYIIYGAVIEKVIAFPAPAFVAVTGIAPSIIDATIKTYARSPIPRCPEETGLGGQHPCSGDPIIILVVVVPRPKAWRPDVAFSRAYRLFVYGQGRRRKSN